MANENVIPRDIENNLAFYYKFKKVSMDNCVIFSHYNKMSYVDFSYGTKMPFRIKERKSYF